MVKTSKIGVTFELSPCFTVENCTNKGYKGTAAFSFLPPDFSPQFKSGLLELLSGNCRLTAETLIHAHTAAVTSCCEAECLQLFGRRAAYYFEEVTTTASVVSASCWYSSFIAGNTKLYVGSGTEATRNRKGKLSARLRFKGQAVFPNAGLAAPCR